MSEMRNFWTNVVGKPADAAASGKAPETAVPATKRRPEEPPDAAASKASSVPATKRRPEGHQAETTIDLGEIKIEGREAKGLAGDTGQQMIKDQLADLQTYIGDYWDNYRDGIQKFTNKMSFASEEEAKAQHLNATISAFGKKALDSALEAAGGKLGGPWGAIIDNAKTAVEAWSAETDRAASAAGEVKAAKFINDLIEGIGTGRNGMRAAVKDGTAKLIDDYVRLSKVDESNNLAGKATPDGRIVGAAAEVVSAVKAGVAAFHKAIPSAGTFQQQFTRAFAATPEITDDRRMAGQLYFKAQLYVEEKDGKREWSIVKSDTSWMLVTTQDHPDRVAESLLESLGGGKPWQIDLPKNVLIRVEKEVLLANEFLDCSVAFDSSPDDVKYVGVGAITHKDLAEEAWNTIRDTALSTTGLKGSNS